MSDTLKGREKTIRARVIVEVVADGSAPGGTSLKIVETLDSDLPLQKAQTKLGQLVRADKKAGVSRTLELILR